MAEEDKPILDLVMIRIGHDDRVFVPECESSLFERDTMLALIGRVLSLVPFESNLDVQGILQLYIRCRYATSGYLTTVQCACQRQAPEISSPLAGWRTSG